MYNTKVPRARKTRQLSITVAQDLATICAQIAENSGVSLSRLVERALFRFVSDWQGALKEERGEVTPVRRP